MRWKRDLFLAITDSSLFLSASSNKQSLQVSTEKNIHYESYGDPIESGKLLRLFGKGFGDARRPASILG